MAKKKKKGAKKPAVESKAAEAKPIEAASEPAKRETPEPASVEQPAAAPQGPPPNLLAAVGWAFAVLGLGVVILAVLSGIDSLLE